ncbi:hypothetical protein CVT26_002726 [Gymnopilus dilepis]|uniref:Uncharacterized protein n=1 Tax=Gymnopilus dilepis TaxID=231916 RepID=A0A409Y3A3_9AGAR|nr:hypothetical protein CVT26_002726 [Gymnopilus dilepis]
MARKSLDCVVAIAMKRTDGGGAKEGICSPPTFPRGCLDPSISGQMKTSLQEDAWVEWEDGSKKSRRPTEEFHLSVNSPSYVDG